MRASYTSIFYDAVLILEEHWDTVVDAVENGTIPDVYDLDYCRPYLEVGEFFPIAFWYSTKTGTSQAESTPGSRAPVNREGKGGVVEGNLAAAQSCQSLQ